MAILYFDGFENGILSSGVTQTGPYNAISGTVSIQSSVKRTGEYALRSNPTTTAVGYVVLSRLNSSGQMRTSQYLTNDVYVKFHFRADTFPAGASSEPIIEFRNSGGIKARLLLHGSGFFFSQNASGVTTLIGTKIISPGTWYQLELRCGTGAASAFTLDIDGVSDINGTQNNSGLQHTFIRLGKAANVGGNSVDFYYDDLIVSDTEFIRGACYRQDVDGNALEQDWAGDYTDIDETPRDNDTTYIDTDGSVPKESWFELEPTLSAGIPTGFAISGVITSACMRRSGAADNVLILMGARHGGVEDLSTGTNPNNATTHEEFLYLSAVNPNTGEAWLRKELDSTEIGLLHSTGAQATRCSRLCLYVWVSETEVSEGPNFIKIKNNVEVPTNATHYMSIRHDTAELTREDWTMVLFKNGEEVRDIAIEVVERPERTYTFSFQNDGTHESQWSLLVYETDLDTPTYAEMWMVKKKIVEQAVRQIQARQDSDGGFFQTSQGGG